MIYDWLAIGENIRNSTLVQLKFLTLEAVGGALSETVEAHVYDIVYWRAFHAVLDEACEELVAGRGIP